MKKFWCDNSFELYNRACVMLNYPEIPFGKFLKEVIKEKDIVADIGCGFGIVSFYIASLCKKVIAIDQDTYALKELEAGMVKRGINNIEILCGIWPDINIEPCDVTVGFYHNKFAHTEEKIDKLLSITKKAGIISCQGPVSRDSFHDDLRNKLGIEANEYYCDNGCYVKGRLEQAGCKVTCENIIHDFGQPVNSFEEATRFLWSQLKVDDEYIVEISKYVQDYIIEKESQMYIPVIRNNCVLIFEK